MAMKRKADVVDLTIDAVYTVSVEATVELDELGDDEELYVDCYGEEIRQEQKRIENMGFKTKEDTGAVYRDEERAKVAAEEAFLDKIEEIYGYQSVFDEDDIPSFEDESEDEDAEESESEDDSEGVERIMKILRKHIASFYDEDTDSYYQQWTIKMRDVDGAYDSDVIVGTFSAEVRATIREKPFV